MCYRQSRRGVSRPNSEKLLHTVAFTQTLLHRKLLPTEAFTYRSFYTDTFTHRYVYTQTLLHTDPFTHRSCFYTQMLVHTEAFTHRRFYTQALLHTNTFTQKHFYTQTLLTRTQSNNVYRQSAIRISNQKLRRPASCFDEQTEHKLAVQTRKIKRFYQKLAAKH